MSYGVLFTAPRRELRAVESLKEMGFEALCPTLLVQTVVRGTKREREVPALSRYIFVGIQVEMPFIRAEEASGAICFVRNGGQPCELSDASVADFVARIGLLNEAKLRKPALYQVGDVVELNEESIFSGFLAQVERVDKSSLLAEICGQPSIGRVRIRAGQIARKVISPALSVSMGLYSR